MAPKKVVLLLNELKFIPVDSSAFLIRPIPAGLKRTPEKSLLKDVILEIESHLADIQKSGEINYNIEIKSKPEWEGIYQPSVDVFVDKVATLVLSKKLEKRANLQSFDLRALKYSKLKYPFIKLAVLVDQEDLPYKDAIKELGFIPEILSP